MEAASSPSSTSTTASSVGGARETYGVDFSRLRVAVPTSNFNGAWERVWGRGMGAQRVVGGGRRADDAFVTV
jgi:hypothetical protein